MDKCQIAFDEWATLHGYSLDADSLGYKDSATSIALGAWKACWDYRYKHPETREPIAGYITNGQCVITHYLDKSSQNTAENKS